jgi:formylglycine-generating enzyme required for sulfatase activity
MSLLFISHSSANNAEAVALSGWLAVEGWNDLFLDLDPDRGIKAGERWERAINEASSRCEAVLFLVSKAWLGSRWCLNELYLARRLNKPLFGILIEEISTEDLPADLKSAWQVVRLASGRDHIIFRAVLPITHKEVHVTFSAEGLRRLKHGLIQTGLEAKYFAWPPANDPDRTPYRGLRSLEIEDAGIFYGRDAPVIEALDRLRGLRETASSRLLVILGASGAGKSSFLRAGLFPRLVRDSHQFIPLPIIRPALAAISGETGFLRALEGAFKTANIVVTRAELRSAIAGGCVALMPLLRKLVEKTELVGIAEGRARKPPTLVIAIDQGEELFLAEGHLEAQAFLVLLQGLLTKDAPTVIALFAIRSDSYERLQLAKDLEGVRQETFSLLPMPKGAYAEVIKGPARRLIGSSRPLKIDDNLVDELLKDIEAGGAKDALPLLAFTLERLYEEYHVGGHIKLSQYNELGRIKGSIEAAVEQALKTADSDPRIPKNRLERLALLRRGLIPWLASIDPETQTPRRRVALISNIPLEARPLIQHLVEQRLLATDITKDNGVVTIEPAHEALLRQWSLLQRWLAEDATLLGILESIKRASKDWVTAGKDDAWLAHAGTRLEAAERLRERPDLAISLEQIDWEYLAVCRERTNKIAAEARDAQRRKRRLELMLVSVLLITSCAGITYGVQTNYDYLKSRLVMLADDLWSKKLTPETEKNYAQLKLLPGQLISFHECTACPEMIVVPGGDFWMGSPADEKGRENNEGPKHSVRIVNNFAVSKFDITFDEWDACFHAHACTDAWDQGWGRGTRPVINVSWNQARQYVNWLSMRMGKLGSYRLLTEAEWEYAARATNPTTFSFGNDDAVLSQYAWYSENSGDMTHPVGEKAPNAFGLYDMNGNVWQWVEDCSHPNYDGAPVDGSAWTTSCEKNYRIYRGGSWYHQSRRLRAAARGKYTADYQDDGVGFRVARTLAAP